jgi:hypothetical protein
VLDRYKLDLVCVQEVRWDKGGTVRAGDYNFFYGKANENHQLTTGYFVHHRIVSAVKRVGFISDRMSYMVLRGQWCNISSVIQTRKLSHTPNLDSLWPLTNVVLISRQFIPLCYSIVTK